MSTGQLPLSSPPFLDIARLRTSLSLVWCAKLKKQTNKQKKKIFQTPVTKNKGRVSLLKSQIKIWNKQTNMNTTFLALTRCLLDWAKRNKRKHTTDDRKVLSLIWPTGFVFVPFDRKENQAETKRQSLDSESVSSYVSTSNPLCLQEGMKEPAS